MLRLILLLLMTLGVSLPAITVDTSPVEVFDCPPGFQVLPDGSCSHGPDPPPRGKDVDKHVPLIPQRKAIRIIEQLPCVDNGTDGPRVQVLYVRPQDRPDRYLSTLPSIQAWVTEVDGIFSDSGLASGGDRHVRWVRDAGCLPSVANVVVPTNGDDTFGASIQALETQGYNRQDRDYLMFMDSTAAGICGIGGLFDDDSPSGGNRNNEGGMYARVDAGCWSGSVAAHELTHNLGGVQLSAPHSSGGFHCIDEWDVMCYSDSPNFPTMQTVCGDRADDATVLDCGKDDYFNVSPAPNSYLGTHWNVANNRYLTGVTAPPPPTPTPEPTGVPPTSTAVPTEIPPPPTVVPPTPLPDKDRDKECKHIKDKQKKRKCRQKD